jgi:SAM-dependent methyltransferase
MYERCLVPTLFAGWAAFLVDLAAPVRGDRVLDAACGTGVVARRAAANLGSSGAVTGLDIDPAMIGVARARATDGRSSIGWCEGDAHRLPFADQSFDIVFCQQGLQFFADAVATVEEMRRVLARGGRIAISVWRGVQPGPHATAIASVLARHLGSDALEGLHSPCAFGGAGTLTELTTRAGLRDSRTSIAVADLRASSGAELFQQAILLTSLAPALRELDLDARTDLIAELEHELRPWAGADGMAIPIEAEVALAQR